MRLSIIIPVYNGEQFLGRCLDSVLEAIDLAKDEIIVIDDASTDRTVELCSKYKKKYPDCFKVYHLDHISGPSRARNLGLTYAEGSYIGFIDGDDYISSDMYEKLIHHMEAKEADMVCCGYCQVEGRHSTKYSMKRELMLDSEECLKSIMNCNIIGDYVWNKLYRKSVLDNIAFPVGEVYEDISTMFKIIERCQRIYVIPDILYYYIKRVNSLTYHPDETKLLHEYKVTRHRNQMIVRSHPGLKHDAAVNDLKLDIFIYSRMAKLYFWKECSVQFEDIRKNIRANRKLFRYLPWKYRVLGTLINYLPRIHGGLMYGKR